MIHRITFKDLSDSKFSYASKLKYFKKNEYVEFKPGLNLIIGENGTGKTTILSMIKWYFLESSSMIPRLDINNFGHLEYFKSFLDENENAWYNGIDINADFHSGVYSQIGGENEGDLYGTLSDMNRHSLSSGQKTIFDFISVMNAYNYDSHIDKLTEEWNERQRIKKEKEEKNNNHNHTHAYAYKRCREIYDPKPEVIFQSPIDIFTYIKHDGVNDIWNKRINDSISWYEKNEVKDGITSFIIDEPDRGLGIKKLCELRDYLIELSKKKDKFQAIIVLHNPLLIKKLIDIEDVNVIETSYRYKFAIKKF